MTTPLLNNRYRILKTLGSGGFGDTFLAEDVQMPSGRHCVIKQLKPITTNPQIYQLVQERFQREAAILEDLGNKSNQIPSLYAYFTEAGQFYLVQEWVQGETLAEKVKNTGTLSESSVKEVLISLLKVLEFVHSKGIIHRDIKPDNIIWQNSGNIPVLIDFGAVKESMGTVLNSQGKSSRSIVIGTSGFMPSEQAAGRPVYSSDIYALGLTAIYTLTGKFPQELPSDPQTGEIIWRDYALNISPTFAAILDKAIQSHPQQRYPTAREMLADLQPQNVAINSTILSPLPPSQNTVPVSSPPDFNHNTNPVKNNSGKPMLVDWRNAIIIGILVGGCIFIAIVLTLGSQPKILQETANNSNSSLSSNNAAPTPQLSQQDALNVINNWLQAKRQIFASPFNRQLVSDLTSDVLARDILKPGGSIDWLRNNNAYYTFGVQKVEPAGKLVANADRATLEVLITEDIALYVNGKLDPTQTGFSTEKSRYSFQFIDGRWKISDYKTIK